MIEGKKLILDDEEILDEIEQMETQTPVSSDEAIEFGLAKIKAINSKIVSIEQKVQTMIERFLIWKMRKVESLESRIEFLKDPLESYMRNIYEKSGGKSKSISVPSGRIQLKMAPDKFEIKDESKVFEWAKFFGPDKYIRIKEELNKKDIVAHIKATGEVPPGIEITKAEKPDFFIVLKEDEEKDE